MENSAKSDTRWASYASFASLYFVVVGALYLWGYWSAFRINILEYLNLADVVKLAVFPLASTSVALLVGMVIAEISARQEGLEHGAGRDTAVGRFLNQHKLSLFNVYFVAILLLYWFGPDTKWYMLPTLLGVPVAFASKEAGFLATELPNESLRRITLLVLSVMPFWSFGQGRLDAVQVKEGVSYDYVSEGSIDGVAVPDPSNEKVRLRYIGHANDYVFLLAPDKNTVVMTHFDRIGTLHLRHHK